MAENKKKKQQPKKAAKRTTNTKAAQTKAKPAAKKPKAKAAPKRAVKATKAAKPAVAKTTRVKALKPDRNYENSTGGDGKIIVLNGKKAQKQQKSGRKQLRRVANIGGYTAWDGRTGKTFATEKEARDYAVDVLKRTGEMIEVTHTQRAVSHTFKAENKADK